MKQDGEKKTKILAAATELFTRYGVRNTTVDQIAKRAGIGKGTIYYYYPDKTSILRDSFSKYLESFRQAAAKISAEVLDPFVRLKKILQFYSEQREKDPLMSMLLYEYKDFRSEEIRECLRDAEHGVVEYVNSLFQEGIAKGQIREVPLPLTAFLFVRMYFAYLLDYEGPKPEGQFSDLMRTFLTDASLVK